MKKGHKKILWVLGIALSMCIAAAIIVAYMYEEKIQRISVEQLNKILKTEVSVKEIEFSLLRRFPKASIEFKEVSIRESGIRKDKINLLKAKSLFMEFNPFNLLTGTYIVDQIYVNSCELNIRFFEDGSNNFELFRSEEEGNDFKISLKKVVFTDADIHFNDDKSDLAFSAKAGKLNLSGDFDNHIFDLSLKSNGMLRSFHFKKLNTKREHSYGLNLLINVRRSENLYSIKSASLDFDKISLNMNGDYQKMEEAAQMNLAFSSRRFKFRDAMFLIPEKIRESFANYNAKGDVIIEGRIKGTSDDRNSPAMDFTFDLENGSLNHKELEVYFKDIVFSGSFTNGSKMNASTSVFTVSEATFTSNFGENAGMFVLSNFDHPYLEMELTSKIDLHRLKENIRNDSLEILEGKCHYTIAGETYLDSLSSINVNDIKQAKARGSLSVENAKIKWKGYKHSIEDIHVNSRFGNNLIYIDTLYYELAGVGSDVRGKLHNFLPFLFFPDEKLSAQIRLMYDDLDLNRIQATNKEEEEKAAFFLPVNNNIKLDVSLSAKKLQLEKFSAENVRCNIISKYPYFMVQDLSLENMEGRFEGWMEFDVSKGDNILVNSKLSLEHVNIRQLFYEFQDFGQSSILSENLNGMADAKISFHAALDRYFSVKEESVEALVFLDIRNGRLMNYKPILAMSKYIDVEELRDISFSKMTNEIEINHRTVFIPEMDIKSSALELKLSGKHDFDNFIDYHFQVWLSDFLFKKAKKARKNEEFGEVEQDDEGRSKLFIRMQGHIDDYKIKLDRKALREKWKDSFNEERSELRGIIRSEFGGEKMEEKEENMNIGIEWEEFEDEETPAKDKEEKPKVEKKKEKKKKSLLDKLGGDMEEEYEEYDADKLD